MNPVCSECQRAITENLKSNHRNFCEVGYRQNPASKEAVLHSLGNRGNVCPRIRKRFLDENERSEA